jgi:hypothetical protein
MIFGAVDAHYPKAKQALRHNFSALLLEFHPLAEGADRQDLPHRLIPR